ncbi:hypothetical protein GCM10017687_27810 [Streptomyces echinatus]
MTLLRTPAGAAMTPSRTQFGPPDAASDRPLCFLIRTPVPDTFWPPSRQPPPRAPPSRGTTAATGLAHRTPSHRTGTSRRNRTVDHGGHCHAAPNGTRRGRT